MEGSRARLRAGILGGLCAVGLRYHVAFGVYFVPHIVIESRDGTVWPKLIGVTVLKFESSAEQ
jgi:hypothetical protein